MEKIGQKGSEEEEGAVQEGTERQHSGSMGHVQRSQEGSETSCVRGKGEGPD